MNKNFVAVVAGSSILLLTMCSSMALGIEPKNAGNSSKYPTIIQEENLITLIQQGETGSTMLEYEAAINQQRMAMEHQEKKTIIENTLRLKDAVDKVKNQINKTWYVFSGSTPSGWDCSGLVMWTYSHLDIELYHSATAQMDSGQIVKNPKYGDVVAFKWNGSNRAYHVGIYIGDDKMIHSGGKKGDVTEIRSISNFAGDHSEVVYSRIIQTN